MDLLKANLDGWRGPPFLTDMIYRYVQVIILNGIKPVWY